MCVYIYRERKREREKERKDGGREEEDFHLDG